MAVSQIKFRHGTSNEWAAFNPTLALGEPGYDTTAKRFKIGDGITTWASLEYTSVSLSELNALVTRADAAVTAANAATTAALAANAGSLRETVNGLAGLDSSGKLYEARYATRLSQASLDTLKARANHTGTQVASTISDLDSVVRSIVSDYLATNTPVGTLPTVPLSQQAQAGDATITATWAAPTSNGGTAITGYKVYRTNPTWVTPTVLSATTFSYTVPNIVNGQSYDVGVAAVTANGTGPIAWTYNITPTGTVTPPASNLPGYPTNVIATPGDSIIDVVWTPPTTTGGSAITGYKVSRTPPTPTYVTGLLGSTVRSFQLTTSTNGTAFTVGVRAVNANGDGPIFNVTGVTPSAGSTPPTPVTGGGLATKVASAWYHSWQLPYLRDIPAQDRTTINHWCIAMAQSGGSGTGTVSWSPNNGQSDLNFIADVDALRAAGDTVVLGVGGSSDGGITITNSTQETQAYNSLVTLIDKYHLDGIDIDLEPSGSSWTVGSVGAVCTRLVAKYGANFIIGVTPGLYDPYTSKWMSLAQTLGSKMTYMAPMLYDFPEAQDSRLNGETVAKIDAMAGAGIPRNKMIMGYMCTPPGGRANTSSPSVALAAYKYGEAQRPGIRGAFIWETYIEGLTTFQWTRSSGVYIRSTG